MAKKELKKEVKEEVKKEGIKEMLAPSEDIPGTGYLAKKVIQAGATYTPDDQGVITLPDIIGVETPAKAVGDPPYAKSVNGIPADDTGNVYLGTLVNTFNGSSGNITIPIVQTVNGVPPDTSGNIPINLTSFATKNLASSATAPYTAIGTGITALGDISTIPTQLTIQGPTTTSLPEIHIMLNPTSRAMFIRGSVADNSYKTIAISGGSGTYIIGGNTGDTGMMTQSVCIGLDPSGNPTYGQGAFNLQRLYFSNNGGSYNITKPCLWASGAVVVGTDEIDFINAHIYGQVPLIRVELGAKVFLTLGATQYGNVDTAGLIGEVRSGGELYLSEMPLNKTAANFLNDGSGLIKIGGTLIS
jgi:hypothetical protein